VLGIDPGLRITGYACLESSRAGITPSIVEAGVFRLVRARTRRADGTAAPTPSVADRLVELDRDFRELLARSGPELVAIEGLFSHYRHPATAIVMGHARGVLLLAARQAGVEVMELKPREVKKAVSGFGGAGKGQVQHTMRDVFALAELPTPPDMADAMAIALCAARRLESGWRASTIPSRRVRVPKLIA
jgi:crossover junction endodeoxyribonuclease RuvC